MIPAPGIQAKLGVSIGANAPLAGVKVRPHAAAITDILHLEGGDLLSGTENCHFLIANVRIPRALIQARFQRGKRTHDLEFRLHCFFLSP